MSSKQRLGMVVGIDNINGMPVYRIVAADLDETAKNRYNWDFKCIAKDENWIKQNFGAVKWLNIDIQGNKIIGSSGSLSRFNNNHNHPIVILSQLVTPDGRIVGYKTVDYNGRVKNVRLKAILDYGKRMTALGGIPAQNAIFVPDEADKRCHFKSYPDHPFITEELVINKNKHVDAAHVSVTENKKSLTRIEEIFSKDQLRELQRGKKEEVNYKLYANPQLTAKQMGILREALKRKVNIRPFASPEFRPECMQYYAATAAAGGDIRNIINPKYTVGQISELYEGIESGVDISKYSDPKLSEAEMQKRRIDLETAIYFEMIIKNGSFT